MDNVNLMTLDLSNAFDNMNYTPFPVYKLIEMKIQLICLAGIAE